MLGPRSLAGGRYVQGWVCARGGYVRGDGYVKGWVCAEWWVLTPPPRCDLTESGY